MNRSIPAWPVLAALLPAACGPDPRLKTVEVGVARMSEGAFQVLSIRKTGGRRSPTVSPEFEIDFEGEAKILADAEVLEPDEFAKTHAGVLEYSRNAALFELFGVGPLKTGETKAFKSICVYSVTKEFGPICRSILRDARGAY